MNTESLFKRLRRYPCVHVIRIIYVSSWLMKMQFSGVSKTGGVNFDFDGQVKKKSLLEEYLYANDSL